MKHLITIAFLVFVLLIAAGCGNNTVDVLTFRAEVLEFDSDYFLQNDDALLFVYSITPVGSHSGRGRYFINRNDSVSVYGMNGEPISYTDIPVGAVVDITYYAYVLQSYPAIIPGAISIQIVELS